MSEADAVAIVLFVGLTMYAVFGGADFGAGLWSLLAGGGELGRRPRQMIDSAIGPVWEANHVWLIFVLVVLWTGFSSAFEAIFSTLFIPLSLAAVGIVLRGSGFAFHHTARTARGRDAAQLLFGLSSILTPFFMGTVVGAIAAGNVPAEGNGDAFSSWLQPLPLLIGAMFVASGGYLAAVFLVGDARRGARPLAVGAVAALIWAWGVAQHPYLLPKQLTIADAAAPDATMVIVFVVFAVAAVVVLPSLGLLYTLAQKDLLESEH